MIIVNVISEIQTREINGRKGTFEVRYQEADLLMPSRRARALEFNPPDGEEYPPGLYVIGPDSVTTGRFDQLELRPRIALIPLPEAIDAAQKHLPDPPRLVDPPAATN